MYRLMLLATGLLLSTISFTQGYKEKIQSLEKDLDRIRAEEQLVLSQLEGARLERLRDDLSRNGLPVLETGETLICHSAMCLVYSEVHEQAKWVAHIITPDIIKGNVSRSNDFRPDPKVATGTAVEADYFLKDLQADSTYEYDGFGYDRGHLAPSADFRWSEKALSQSYYYSNMSPQLAAFNRGKWAELEALIRGYIFRNPASQLYVVTGPVLKDDLPKVNRSINGVSVPKLYFKVAIDLEQKRAVAFLMPNKEISYPIRSFAVSIDKVEEETGLDLFASLPDGLETMLEQQDDLKPWLPPTEQDDVDPMYAPDLNRNHFNTVQAKRYMGTGEKIHVCGTVVSTNLSRKGNVFLNLDKKFPNQIFTVTIWKDKLVNFSYEPHKELVGKQVCFEGKVRDFNGTPSMSVEKEEGVEVVSEK